MRKNVIESRLVYRASIGFLKSAFKMRTLLRFQQTLEGMDHLIFDGGLQDF